MLEMSYACDRCCVVEAARSYGRIPRDWVLVEDDFADEMGVAHVCDDCATDTERITYFQAQLDDWGTPAPEPTRRPRPSIRERVRAGWRAARSLDS